MKKITIKKTWGKFDVVASVNVTDEQREVAQALGFLYLFERQPSQAIEQKVLAPMQGWQKGKRGTSYQRPKDWTRSSVPYSKDMAEKFKTTFEATPAKLGADVIKFTVESIVEHVGGSETATKEGIALWEQVQGLPEDEFNGACVKLGIDPDDYDDERGIGACMAHLRKLKAEVSAKALNALK
jgi:hypothetical protein